MTEQMPAGMYPIEPAYGYTDFDTFDELTEEAECLGWVLNVPIGWFIGNRQHEAGSEWFELVFLLPRMLNEGRPATVAFRTFNYQRPRVQAWLETFVRPRIMSWYGFDDET